MNRSEVPSWAQPIEAKITPPQRSYLLDLIAKKDPQTQDPEFEGKLDLIMKSLRISEDPEEYGMSKAQASKLIDWFLKQPDKPREIKDPHAAVWKESEEQARNSDLPDGYYALTGVEGHKNETSFFRLRTPKSGNWIGYQFVDQVVGHGKRFPVKGAAASKVRQLIKEQGINEARQLYGQEIGACGICGRELTDDTSRARGIGPDCWSRL